MRFSLLLALILTGFSGLSQTITFQETMMVNRQQTGYSVLNIYDPASSSDEYLLAGTVLQQSVSDSTDLRVFRTDGAGAILWEKTYSTGENDRCLGIDHSGDGFILTGYSDTGSINAQMFLMQIDANGNILNQMRYESPMTGQTQGLGVQHTLDNGYIVAGFVAAGYFNNDPKQSYVMKVDSNLNPVWSRYFDTPWDINRDLDMAENVIEIPGVGYFVSGSVNIKKYNSSPTYNLTYQGVMAMMVDLNGNLLWNSSLSVQDSLTTGHWGVGVRSYFDVSSNQVYLMANNSEAHQFNITVFDLSGNIVNHWDYNSLLYGLAGFDLIESNDPTKLVACALATFLDFQVGSTWYSFNYPPVLLEFDKSDGTQAWSNLYKVPSENYGTLQNGMYTPLAGQQPEIFTPEMAVKSRNGGYAVAGNRSNASSYFDLEIIKVANNGWVECPKDTLQFIPQTLTRFISDSVTVDSGFTAAPINFVVDTLGIISTFCAPPDTCVCDLVPHFSASTSDSCTWQFADVSTLDSCYDICTWIWDFGDGDVSSLQNPAHTYDTSGVYAVCMSAVVCGPNGIIECEDIFCDTITVFCDTCSCEIEPIFSATTTDSCTFQFTDMITVDTCYNICGWNWTFGDGGTSSLQNPIYTYAASSNG